MEDVREIPAVCAKTNQLPPRLRLTLGAKKKNMEKNVFQSMAQTGEETEGEARRPHEAEAQDVAGKSKRGSDDGFAERADDASGAARPPAGLAYPGFVEEVSTPPPRAAVRSLGES